MRHTVLAILLGVTSWGVLSAQQAPPASPPAIFRTGVDMVTLDVSVIDNRRRPIRGLTAGDFRVVEDGVPLPITAFKAVEIPEREVAAAAWLTDVASDVVTNRFEPDRLIVLLLDDWNVATDPAAMMQTRRIAHAIVDELSLSDSAAIVYTFAHEKSQEFTNDKARLRQAIDRFTSSRMPDASGSIGMPPLPSMACPHNECVTATFRAVSDVMRENWPGRRKTIAYISPEGTYTIGPQPIGDPVTGLTKPGESAAVWDSGPDLQRTFRALQEANVNVYQYDPRDLKDSLDLIVQPNTTGQMGIFAANTGGRIVSKTNAPAEQVDEMFIENSSYYMLGVQPSTTPGKTPFRPVTVTVSRPGATVRTRPGYFRPTAEKTKPAKTPPSALDRVMAGERPTGELPLSLIAVPFAMPTGPAVAVVAGLDRESDLPGTDTVEIAARAFTQSRGDRRSQGVARTTVQLSRRGAGNGVTHYDVATRLDLAPGQYEIRLGADSAATRLSGSAFAYVTVPDFTRDRLSASGLTVTRLPASRAVGKDTLGSVWSFTPTTIRTFTRTARVASVLRLYQGEKQPLSAISVRARIVDEIDKTWFDAADTVSPDERQPTPRTAEYRLELPLATLDPGEYLLTIDANAGPAAVSRRLRFRME